MIESSSRGLSSNEIKHDQPSQELQDTDTISDFVRFYASTHHGDEVMTPLKQHSETARIHRRKQHGSWIILFISLFTMQTILSKCIHPSTRFAFAFCPSCQLRSPLIRTLTLQAQSNAQDSPLVTDSRQVRIGIIGGGIAGVSVAHALAKTQQLRLENQDPMNKTPQYSITILEAGMPTEQEDSLHVNEEETPHQPKWKAATARNGNSLVPAASFSVMSQKDVFLSVFKDTASEMRRSWKQALSKQINRITMNQDNSHYTTSNGTPGDQDNKDFLRIPPYFALNIWRCAVSPNTTHEERISFLRFGLQYLYYALWVGQDAANDRAKLLGKLAQANRNIFLAELQDHGDLSSTVGLTKGFLALFRTRDEADETLRHILDVGEEAEGVLEWDQLIKLEPRLGHLPDEILPLFGVRKPNDCTASCNTFVRSWIESCRSMGVKWLNATKVNRICRNQVANEDKHFTVYGEDNSKHEFDILVLAAGPECPLILASQFEAGKYCPTYPLRGFSLTTYFSPNKSDGQPERLKHDLSSNVLHQPFKLDNMYCSSVSPQMARWAGFGEFAGYRTSTRDVPSVAPDILARYAKAVFPDSRDGLVGDPVPCFRAMSPDDLPLAGEVPSVDGLFLHTGHGSLGWTIGLATGEIVSQSIVNKNFGDDSILPGRVRLSDGTEFDSSIFSPNRFRFKI